MAGVLQTSQPLNERFTLPASNSPGNVDVLVVDPGAGPAGIVQPFRATFYVNPLFVGTSTGSQSNPFKTVAAAFAAGAAAGYTAGLIVLAPATNLIENIVFPVAGGAWGITAQQQFGTFSTTITGNVDMSSAAASEFSMTNLDIEGVVTGNATGAGNHFARFFNSFLSSTLTLTSATAQWICELTGEGSQLGGGEVGSTGAVTVQGRVIATTWNFLDTVTMSRTSQFFYCTLPLALATTAGTVNQMQDCIFRGATVVTANGGQTVWDIDGWTATRALSSGITTAGASATVFRLGDSNGLQQRLTLANNLGGTTWANRMPPCQYVAEVALTLLVPGTLGAIQVNITYTDLLGVLRTRAVGITLNAAGAAGDIVSGSLSFSQNGATSIVLSITGVVTPGALSYQADCSLRLVS